MNMSKLDLAEQMNRDGGGLFRRIAIHAGADAGKRDAGKSVCDGEFE